VVAAGTDGATVMEAFRCLGPAHNIVDLQLALATILMAGEYSVGAAPKGAALTFSE
jgi:hypothetical protein